MSFTLHRGAGPLVLSVPHAGTDVPAEVAARFTEAGRSLADTDWLVGELYGFVEEFDASTIEAKVSRYVIDLNRDPSGASLYPGQSTTELVPSTTFSGAPLYAAGDEPDEDEVRERRDRWFVPYHDALAGLLEETRARHGYALLWDAHSIVSESPRLFDGVLPELNLGTNRGRSAAPSIAQAAGSEMESTGYSHVTDGRFTGGWITRNYGRPAEGVHALQMELAQRTHLDEMNPTRLDRERTATLRPALRKIIAAALDAASQLKDSPS